MAKWTAFPHDTADYTYDAAALKKTWARLQCRRRRAAAERRQGACGVVLFHAGEFQKRTRPE